MNPINDFSMPGWAIIAMIWIALMILMLIIGHLSAKRNEKLKTLKPGKREPRWHNRFWSSYR